MSHSEVSKSNHVLTFLGSLGAILIFALVIFVAYLPNRPDPVAAETNATRQTKADESRAQGTAKLGAIDTAMELTVNAYQKED